MKVSFVPVTSQLLKSLVFLLFSYPTSGQVIGKYISFNTLERLELKADSTFEHQWHFDLVGKWSKGIWHQKGDVLELRAISIFDTVPCKRSNAIGTDSLILSVLNNESGRGYDSIIGNNGKIYFDDGSFSVSQDTSYYEQLKFGKNRLYLLNNSGRIIRKKHKMPWPMPRRIAGFRIGTKKFKPGYRKVNL